MNILISVYNKEGLLDFLKNINLREHKIYASGGTFRYLKENGIEGINSSELTGFEDLLQGRVKTLHPAIFSGILSRDTDSDRKDMNAHGFPLFDMVICNLYPFDKHAAGGDIHGMIENIDIGGVSLIRAAAKNNSRVTVIVEVSDYDIVRDEINSTGMISENTRRKLAVKAFELTSAYDSMISRSLANEYHLQTDGFSLMLRGGRKLRYGENPDQEGCIYPIPGTGIWKVEHGKEMSYNNYLDASSALETCDDFDEPTAVVVKHNTPCGVASSDSMPHALISAINSDRESAYGSVICVNREFDLRCAQNMKDLFVEVVMAPSFSVESLEILSKKKSIRIVTYEKGQNKLKMRSIYNAMLVQTLQDTHLDDIKTVSGNVDADLMNDLLFAWKVVAHCRSNAMVLAKDRKTVGIGAGQTSRVEALRIAISKSSGECKGSALASDAYLPFADNVELAAANGISGIIQPGGSIRDGEIIEACQKSGIGMVFTGKRVFLH
ncbi:MAG: bifunctional phosphoribosylaminoimidazolecarboxamide formyltransferase/IMP cyclohydrolase [Thermoplasmataceae archaeon]